MDDLWSLLFRVVKRSPGCYRVVLLNANLYWKAVTSVPYWNNDCLLEANVIHQDDDNGQAMRMELEMDSLV